jgi:sodium/potassium-transporting ATPase subunit alpha
MNPAQKNPTRIEDNLCIYLKGAPDRVLVRCNRIMVDGAIMDLTDEVIKEIEDANDKFGNMGERVLGFSKIELECADFDKEMLFDVKKWQMWKDVHGKTEEFPGWFPMWNLKFIGLVSLNDPPRKGVDMSVLKCRSAGIKVIMVTGDQKNTGAAIAAKVNIIQDKELEFNWMMANIEGMTEEKAMAECKAIVVHGDELAAVNFEEEGFDDQEVEKGRKVMDWIRVDEVVFARTTPSQKLLIVDACQKLGHVVAVTGDGVNDSPAIKKADIGVAMGCGSEVAQNAGDMILLDDNFSSIVNGVEEGRLIFDNLKKSIAYTLSSNIPEISPFLLFILCRLPLPLSTVLILCIDLGTDMVPAISFAYENPELDIMERYPRNSKRDHLVNAKLISFAYLQIGMTQASAGFFTYFYMLHDYGIRPGTTFGMATEMGYIPEPSDVYNPNAMNFGNSNWMKKNSEVMLNWNGNKHNSVDIRLFYGTRGPSSWSKCRWVKGETGLDFYSTSHVSGGKQICYTTEALRYAQAGYLISIVCVQWSDLMICKTRALSISQQGMINGRANFGLFFETALVAILCYVPFLNAPLGTRQIAFPHFAVPSFSFFCVIMAYDELRKIFLRNGIKKSHRGRAKYDGWVVRNTYY